MKSEDGDSLAGRVCARVWGKGKKEERERESKKGKNFSAQVSL